MNEDVFSEVTSGYSSAKTSPKSSNENLQNPEKLRKVRRKLDSLKFDFDSDHSDHSEHSDDETEAECEFRPVVTADEAKPHMEWYNKLLDLRRSHPRGVKHVFPPFPPPPLPSAMLKASRAQTVNPFEEVKRAAVSNSTNSPSTSSPNYINRFCPTDFRALPPPHVFLSMIRSLAPHQYVDLTYSLAGAVLLDIGAKVPDRYPPLPPKIDPFREIEEENPEPIHHEGEMSSQSSSEGEYSDDSEDTKLVTRIKRVINQERRAERKVRITARRIFLEQYAEVVSDSEKEKNETFHRDQNYKSKILSKFIPPRPPRPPPMMPFFRIPTGPPDSDSPPFMPIMMIPIGPPPPPPPSQQLPQVSHTKLRLRYRESAKSEPKKIMLSFPDRKTSRQ